MREKEREEERVGGREMGREGERKRGRERERLGERQTERHRDSSDLLVRRNKSLLDGVRSDSFAVDALDHVALA